MSCVREHWSAAHLNDSIDSIPGVLGIGNLVSDLIMVHIDASPVSIESCWLSEHLTVGSGFGSQVKTSHLLPIWGFVMWCKTGYLD